MSGEASLILGGQIRGRAPEIMLIYPQGNYIEASNETPYLQIGETKYGKPVLDRFLESGTPLERAALIALISLEGTARSNVTVGPPFEIGLMRRDSFACKHMSFGEDTDHLMQVRTGWEQGLRGTLDTLPQLDWESAPSATPLAPDAPAR